MTDDQPRKKIELTFDDEEPTQAHPPATPCPSCGAQIAANLAFCTSCGTALAAPTPATEQPPTQQLPPVRPRPEPTPVADNSNPRVEAKRRLLGHVPTFVWIALIAVLAGTASLFVLKSLFSEERGADSPSAAAQQLVNAIVAEDPAGIASILAPDETRGLGDLVKDTVQRGRKAKFFSDSGGTVDGVQFSLSGLQLDDQPLSDSVHRISATSGTASVTTKAADAHEVATQAGLEDDITKIPLDEAKIIVVKKDGKWFVSPTLTAADTATRLTSASAPVFTNTGSSNNGELARTPEEAVKRFFDAVVADSAAPLSSSLAGPERTAVQAFRAAADEGFNELEPGGSGTVTGGDFQVSDLGGSYKKVAINSLNGNFDGSSFSFDGQCMRADGETGCISELTSIEGPNGTYSQMGKGPIYSGRPFVIVHKESGGWGVSVTATAIEYLREILKQHPRDTDLARMLNMPALVAPAATINAGETARIDKVDGEWANVRVNRGKAYGVAIKSGCETGPFAVTPNGPVYDAWLGGEGNDNCGQLRVFVPNSDGAIAGSYLVSATAPGGRVSAPSFAVPSVKQKLPSDGKIDVTIPLTAKQPVVALTGAKDTPFSIDGPASDSVRWDCQYLDGGCGFPVIVAITDGKARKVKLRLSTVTTSINGSDSASEWIYGTSPTTFNLTVGANETARIRVTPDDSDLDVVVSTDDGERVDRTLSGDSEVIVVAGPFDGDLSVWSYSDDESGQVTVSIE